MRHSKHRFQLGRKKEHRAALMANLSTALFTHGRIQTTLAKAKALRPYAEKIITMACKASAQEDRARKLHYWRQAYSRVRSKDAVTKLFNERAEEFKGRQGGYTRIYKLSPRIGDAADMALIELIPASDEGYNNKRKKKTQMKKKDTSVKKEDTPKVEAVNAEVSAEEATQAKSKADSKTDTKE